MNSHSKILNQIKESVKHQQPDATIILYGSYARGDNHAHSDIDILILLNKDKITSADERNIKYPLYDIEFDTGQIISPLVFSVNDWEKRHKITPLYQNILREGIRL
ncbi:MAG: nucleotidyltransferase domain-containing protein [Bacteroidia bacterium]